MPTGICEAIAPAIITAVAGGATTAATLASKGDDEKRFVPTEELAPDNFEKQLSQNRINIQKQPNLSLRSFNQPRRLTRF